MRKNISSPFLITFLFWTVASCVDPYYCCQNKTQEHFGPLWDCTRCKQQKIPLHPPSNATAINLEANEISEIPKGSFRNYQNVKWLKLTNNSLTLKNGTAYFDGLTNLTYLSIARNNIVLTNLNEHNPDIFKPLVNLTELNIYRVEYNKDDDRHFEEYPGKFLAPLTRLEKAHLPVVSFDRMGTYMSELKHLISLSFLGSMPGTAFLWKTMRNETFELLPSLQSIHLVDSSLTTIEPYALRPLQNLNKLQVFCSSLQAIDVIQAIANLPNASLEKLIFEYDKSLADIPGNKTFPSLSNLSSVVMGIPMMVPHPNPFVQNFLPIFWESVHKIDIIRPYQDKYVRTVYRNPDDPTKPELEINILHDIQDVPYRSACIITGQKTKIRQVRSIGLLGDQFPQIQANKTAKKIEGSQDARRHETVKHEPDLASGRQKGSKRLKKSRVNGSRSVFSSSEGQSQKNAINFLQKNVASSTKTNTFVSEEWFNHPASYSEYSANIGYRLLSLTLSFYISYSQSQVFDLLISQGKSLGIRTELLNLTVNHFLYNTLPGDGILQNLTEFNINGAKLAKLGSRDMPNLMNYDISYNFISNLTSDELSRLHQLQLFNASNNHLIFIDKNSFENASDLTLIDLSQNYLERISLKISHLKRLKKINLSRNKIKYLPEEFIWQISIQSRVLLNLSANALLCGCGQEYINSISWMQTNSKFFENFDEYTCSDMYSETRLIKDIDIEKYKAECKSKLPIYITIPILCSIVLMVVMFTSYKHRWQIMWYVYTIRNSCQPRPPGFRNRVRDHGQEPPLLDSLQDGDEYDIFLCCAQDDMEMIYKFLDRMNNLNVMHYERFQWGKSVYLQSVSAVQQSQKCVFLLTENSVKSDFVDFQLHMAVINGLNRLNFIQVNTQAVLMEAGIQPFWMQLLTTCRTFDYEDVPHFWESFQRAMQDN